MIDKIEVLARLIYASYSEAVGGKAFNGDPLPSADDFFNDENKQKQANAYRKSASDALDFVKGNPELYN